MDDNDTMDHMESVNEIVYFADAVAAAFAREAAAYNAVKSAMQPQLQADCQRLIEYSAVVRQALAQQAAAGGP